MEYQIHLPEYLAKCINKSRPELHCNGQCILMKKIREKEKNDVRKSLMVYEYSALYVHVGHLFFQSAEWGMDDLKQEYPPFLNDYAFTHSTSLDRPPII